MDPTPRATDPVSDTHAILRHTFIPKYRNLYDVVRNPAAVVYTIILARVDTTGASSRIGFLQL